MKVHIEVDSSELHKLKAYTIVQSDVALREMFAGSSSIGELSDCDIDEIIEVAKKAMLEGVEFGIVVDVELGRSSFDDSRTYDLVSVHIDCVESSDYTVAEMLKAINV
jgi:hypothetical protein